MRHKTFQPSQKKVIGHNQKMKEFNMGRGESLYRLTMHVRNTHDLEIFKGISFIINKRNECM